MLKVVMYRRVSTSTQANDGFGLDVQKEMIESYCRANNIEIVGNFVDSGISGTSDDREGLLEALNMLDNKEADKIIVRDTGRLWRDIYQQSYVMSSLKQYNSDFISVEEPNLNMYALENDPSQYLVNTILQALANHQRMEIKRKLSKGRQAKAKKGDKACGVAPLGYKWNDGIIIVDSSKAPIVETIFKKYLELGSFGKVKKYLDSNGYKTNRDKLFSKQSIKDILENDFYKGIVTHGDIKKTGNHDPIINKITFGKVQSLLNKNSSKE